MEAVDTREDGDKQTSSMKMVITDASGKKRSRSVSSQALDFEGGTKQLIFFEAPADVRNTGLLTIDYDDGNKVDDQWLWLPSLGKSTRISSDSRSGAFMGSDFSFADMTRLSPDQYDFKMHKQEVEVDGEKCWVIESRPRTPKAKDETGYVKSRIWVSKAKMMPIRSKHWIKKGKKLKYMKMGHIKKIDGIWIAQKLSARTARNKETLSKTVLTFSKIKFNNPEVTAERFSQRTLEKGL